MAPLERSPSVAFPGRFRLQDETPSTPPAATDDVTARRDLLRAVEEGAPQVVRLVRPQPAAAFTRRDEHLPGYAAAVETARRHGFTPVLRPVGGRMAPYHRGCLVVDVAGRADDSRSGATARFEAFSRLLVEALGPLGLDVRVGEVPREYCPGPHSVNLGGAVKVAGIAQRQTRRGWLVSAHLVVTGSAALRAVATAVYADLGLALDPGTVGALSDHAPHVTVDRVAALLVSRLADTVDLQVLTPSDRATS